MRCGETLLKNGVKMKKTIKINFIDYGKRFDPKQDIFFNLLETKYKVDISDDPDYIFYTLSGNEHHKYDGIRIFWTGENVVPNFNVCDYAFGFNWMTLGDRYKRYPLWATYKTALQGAMARGKEISDNVLLARGFCALVISNAKQTDGVREKLYHKLALYKKIASGGRWKNNVGGPVKDKVAFQKDYKFVLACENMYSPGYTTEKILEGFASNAIPIYYGDPDVVLDFNPKAFINSHDFKTMDDLVKYVKEVDEDDALYLKMIREPIFKNGKLPEEYTDQAVLSFLSNIFDQPKEKARRKYFIKPYLDIDYSALKARDIKAILLGVVKKEVRKIFKKRQGLKFSK